MTEKKTHIQVYQSDKERLPLIKKEFLRVHPEFKYANLTQKHLVKIMMDYFLKTEKDFPL